MKKKGKILLFFIRNSFKLSKKQLGKPATLISFGGFALSVAILTASLTLLNGYHKTLKEGLLGVNAHVYLYPAGNDRLDSSQLERISGFLQNAEEVEAYSPVIMTQVMAVGEKQVKGAAARSIEWEKENLPTDYHRFINKGSGKLLERNDAVLGSELASYLQVGIGDQIQLITPANMEYTIFGLRTGEVNVNVTGIFKSGVYDTDSRTIFLNEDIFSSIAPAAGSYNLVEIKLTGDNVERADYISYLWDIMLEREFLIYSWIDFNSNLFTMLVLQRWVIAIILSFLILIASFNIISNTTTSILEKKKEIGILKATGCSNGLIKSFFLGKTTLMSLVAIIIGIGSGLVLAYIMTKQTYLMLKGDVYFIEHFTISPDISTIAVIILISLLIAVWAAFISLKKISQLTVIETLRYD